MEKKLLIEEIGRIKYLFGHKRGVVISENTYDISDWKGKDKGKIDFLSGDLNVAKNVKFNGQIFNMTTSTLLPKISNLEPNKGTTITLEDLELSQDVFPYPDNMIGPKFDRYPDSQILYDRFIDKLRTFVDLGGFGNITSIKIQGTADGARPNTRVPRPYSSLDHNLVGDSEPYGGETNRSKMNKYLADNRAKVLGQMIVTQISASTGVDISSKIQYLPSINYYGQRDKIGQQYRGVFVTPEYTPLVITDENVDTETQEQTQRQFVDLSLYGLDSDITAEVKDGLIAIKNTYWEKLRYLPIYYGGKLNNKQTVDGKIVGEELFVDDISFGKFRDKESDELNGQFDDRVDTLAQYITIGKPVIVKKDTEYKYIKVLKFGLVKII